MTIGHEDTENRRLTPPDEGWEAEFDPDYDKRKEEGGDWEFLDDDEIVIRQIQEFHDDALAEDYRKEDERKEAEDWY